MIQVAWENQKVIKEVMVFLQGHGVSTTYAVKIFKQYGWRSPRLRITHQLATDIYGIGFVTADAIGRNMGVAPDSEFRYRAGIIHVLGEAAEEGTASYHRISERVAQRLSLPDLSQTRSGSPAGV